MTEATEFEKIVALFRARVAGVQAVAVLDAGGEIEELAQLAPGFDPGTLQEFATLVRIAERVSVDATAGGLSAMTWKTDNAVVLMHRVPPDKSILLVGSGDLPASLARYQLSRAASLLARRKSRQASL